MPSIEMALTPAPVALPGFCSPAFALRFAVQLHREGR
jgi:hypothetical protein